MRLLRSVPSGWEMIVETRLLVVLALLMIGGVCPAAEPQRPNILLIMADDLGHECLGCYGGTSYRTPHLDALARGGVRFTNCFSTPKCSPSRVTIMTGRYTFRTTDQWGHLPPREITFGHVLRRAGYGTALAGKWQMVLLRTDPNHVTRSGFERNCCWAWHEGPRYWQPVIWQNGRLRDDVADRYGPDVYCDFLIEFIQGQRQPWLAYYPMTLCHLPKRDEPKGPDGRWESFAQMVAEMGRQVGRLVAVLDRLKLRRKTLILFVGDNGSPTGVVSRLGDRSIRGGKATLKDAGTRVPLLANWPSTAPAGAVNDDLIDFSDFMPTLAELAGAKPPQAVTIDGRSFAAQLRGRPGDPRQWVHTEWQGKRWVRNKRWKLYADGKLYDMSVDPEEARPCNTAESADARKKLQAAFKEVGGSRQ